jgi:ABC-type dipeptide/oligopeptide/nickel transport system permease subunit
MLKRKNVVSESLGRFARFLAIFARNPRGLIGLIIIAFFIFMALGAPLLTPYDPVRDKYVSGSYSAPIWLKYLPATLGGRPNSAENMKIQNNSDFADSLEEWNYTTSPHTSVTHSSDIGAGDGPKGSAKITFQRTEKGTTYGNATVALTKEFYYPFSQKPRKFTPSISLLANGTESETVLQQTKQFYNVTSHQIETIVITTIRVDMDVNITVSVYLQRISDGQIFLLWPYQNQAGEGLDLGVSIVNRIPQPGTIYNVTGKWIDSSVWAADSDGIRYQGVMDVNPVVFNETALPGNYRLGVNVTFQDLDTPSKEVEATIYVDDLYMTFEGTVWGVMGTDHYGADLWSQLVYGSRISLYIGLLASVISVGLGLTVGLAAGYLGKYVDEVLMRFSDMLLVLPGLPLLIVLIAVLGPSTENLILIIGLLGWMGFARLVRSQVLTIKERPFVEAAKAVGAGKTHIISKHILPNVMSLVYVTLATSVPGAIVSEAALSFLGFYDPTKTSWGRMLFEVQANGAVQYWWWVIPPGLCIAILAIAFIMLGFALDEVINPRLRLRR